MLDKLSVSFLCKGNARSSILKTILHFELVSVKTSMNLNDRKQFDRGLAFGLNLHVNFGKTNLIGSYLLVTIASTLYLIVTVPFPGNSI